MSSVNSLKLNDPSYPDILRNIEAAPKELFFIGADPSNWLTKPRVAIVGSRKMSSYGKEVAERFASGLARHGIVVISGLALGIDGEAHRAVVQQQGFTVAVLPTSLDKIYPSSHNNLARQIVACGGTLISEHRKGAATFKTSFMARNRIISGLSDVVVVIEAAARSGTLNTVRYALEQGKTVMAVPGNITSENSEGTNQLLKSGALPATTVEDILFALNINPKRAAKTKVYRGTKEEETLLRLIKTGTNDQETLANKSGLTASEINSLLTILEINGHIRPLGGGKWGLS